MSRLRDLWQRDLRFLIALGCFSLLLGSARAWIHRPILSFKYRTPEERLRMELKSVVATQHSSVPVIQVSEARNDLTQKNVLFLDVRSTEAFKKKHIPGAFHVPSHEFSKQAPPLFQKLISSRIQKVIVYCEGGKCQDSRMIAELLAEMKLCEVWILEGGWQAWEAKP